MSHSIPNSTQQSNIPYGYCQCGCGQKTSTAPRTNRGMGHVKGEPYRFVNGHPGGKSLHAKDECASWVAKYGLRSPYGKCQCGCGQDAPISRKTDSRKGLNRGQPARFFVGHYRFFDLRKDFVEPTLPPDARAIPLTQGKFAIVDAADFEWLSRWNWSAYPKNNTVYAGHRIRLPDGSSPMVWMHREIINAEQGMLIDHVDMDGLNNRRGNLRHATQSQNHANSGMQRNNTSGFKGVSWKKDIQKWCAQVSMNGKKFHVGSYDSAEEAARAYDKKARELHGEFVRVNFHDSEQVTA